MIGAERRSPRVMTLLGTRPEVIRLSLIVRRLDTLCEQTVVHTGQNYDYSLDGVFFDELGVRAPDVHFGARGTFAEQLSTIFPAMERAILRFRPERLLVLGDTNSSVAAVVGKRMGVPVYHMEAGNRCRDDRVPEEVNRRVIDHASDVLMPYTERSRQNLLREGIPEERIFVTGNPIREVLDYYGEASSRSGVLQRLGVREGEYFLVTAHRQENVDVPGRLGPLVEEAFPALHQSYGCPVVVSTHPRTRAKLGTSSDRDGVRYLDPFGFLDFLALERGARCVLTDSGTVQEECSILGVPCVTLRDSTERPETIEWGGNILSGVSPDSVLRCARIAMETDPGPPPPEYERGDVSATVCKILLGFPPLSVLRSLQ